MKDINLIPISYIEKKANKKKRVLGTISAFIMLSLLIVGIGYPLWIRFTVGKEKSALEAKVKESINFVNIENQLSLVKDLYKNREETGNLMRESGIDVIEILDRLEKASPEDLFIVTFNASEAKDNSNEITLTGISKTQDEVATFVRKIREDEYFDSVSVAALLKTDEEYNFNMSIYFGAGK